VPCLAVFDLGRSIKSGDDFLGDYSFKFGSRSYATDDATTFNSAGSKELTGSFTLPETDLAGKYEDKDVEVAKSANVEILNEKTFGFVEDTF
jgi:hypothetical protein